MMNIDFSAVSFEPYHVDVCTESDIVKELYTVFPVIVWTQ